MAEYIERNALIRQIICDMAEFVGTPNEVLKHDERCNYAIFYLKNASIADVVPVARCKDCCHSYDDIGGLTCSYGPCVDCIVPEDFYCKHGERKERMTSESNQEKYIIGDCKDFS